ncbi:MAG TPA: hypothetical protein VFC73_00895 [Syntrophomonadaceae bacterium]|nr:hypothetical protein [Syntrophomonadaceae bacterium]
MITQQNKARIVEAFVGEYASGKSEIAINRALELKGLNHQVTLVDLDTVEPFYTLRPLKALLEGKGLNVISYTREDSFGLGETGAMLNPAARWALMNKGDIILDIGYGIHGAKTLNLVEGAYESSELRIIAVINYTRPMTNSPEKVREYLLELGRLDGIIANTHLGNQTTLDVIVKGNNEILRVANELNIPVDYMGIDKTMYEEISDYKFEIPVKFIERYMVNAMW